MPQLPYCSLLNPFAPGFTPKVTPSLKAPIFGNVVPSPSLGDAPALALQAVMCVDDEGDVPFLHHGRDWWQLAAYLQQWNVEVDIVFTAGDAGFEKATIFPTVVALTFYNNEDHRTVCETEMKQWPRARINDPTDTKFYQEFRGSSED